MKTKLLTIIAGALAGGVVSLTTAWWITETGLVFDRTASKRRNGIARQPNRDIFPRRRRNIRRPLENSRDWI